MDQAEIRPGLYPVLRRDHFVNERHTDHSAGDTAADCQGPHDPLTAESLFQTAPDPVRVPAIPAARTPTPERIAVPERQSRIKQERLTPTGRVFLPAGTTPTPPADKRGLAVSGEMVKP